MKCTAGNIMTGVCFVKPGALSALPSASKYARPAEDEKRCSRADTSYSCNSIIVLLPIQKEAPPPEKMQKPRQGQQKKDKRYGCKCSIPALQLQAQR